MALHGWLDNAMSFSQLAPLLSDAGCHVIAMDLPGHGNSEHFPSYCSYTFVDYARIIGAWMEDNAGPYVLVVSEVVRGGV